MRDGSYFGSLRDYRDPDYLAAHPGRALLATGSKELAPYTRVPGYQESFYPRVLPMASSL